MPHPARSHRNFISAGLTRNARAALQLAVAALALQATHHALAVTDTFTGPSAGNWNVAANWTTSAATHLVPVPGDDAMLGIAGTVATYINFNMSYTSPLNSLTINAVTEPTVTLNQTTASVMSATTENIGTTIFGNFYVQSAGTNTTSVLNLGSAANASSQGAYLLSGSGSLTAATEVIGASPEINDGGNFFTQTGGSNTVTGTLTIGGGVNGVGTYALSAGALSTPGITIGDTTTPGSSFTQTGGTVSVTSAGFGVISVGTGVGSNASYTIDATDGASTLTTPTLYVGDNGTGLFTQNGGNVTVATSLVVGRGSTSNGTFTLNAGNLTAGANGASGNVVIAFSPVGTATGTINQSGGNFTLTGADASLTIGELGTGAYNLSGGSLTTALLQLADQGNADFTQTGGAVNAAQLNLANTTGTAATYELSGTSTLNVSTSESLGVSGTGQFFQSGGTHTLVGELQLGQNATGNGFYAISDGNLNVTGSILIGNAGIGAFSQNGGNVTISADIDIGGQAGSSGTLYLEGGTLSVATIFLGARNATASLLQGGGNLLVQRLVIGDSSIGIAPGGGTTVYSQTAGNLTVTSSAALGSGNQPASYTLTGGILNAPAAPSSFLIAANGTFNFNGGTINGYILNQGLFNSTGGAFNGTLENDANGVANFTGFTSFGAGLINHGTLNLIGGGFFVTSVGTAAGQTLNNDGTITLSASAQLASSGPVINNGLITGTGTLGGSGTGAFTNNLNIVQGAGPLTFSFAGAATNYGTITLAAGRTLNLIDGFTNSGNFQINGASIIQSGTLANSFAGTVEGPGTILAGFTNTGTVLPGAGTLNIATPWTNAGILELTGPSSAIAGGTITNTGTLQGVGSVGSPVTNNGTIEALGGTLVIAAPLSNPATGTLAASTSNKLLILSGLATNAGFLSLTGGTFDNNNQPLNNTGQISGFGTFRTGAAGLTNNGAITFSGSNGATTTTINGNVTNNANKTINIKFNPAIFTGSVLNNANATIATTNTTATFAGPFTNNGTYSPDPSTTIFQSTVTSAGTMTGGTGDAYLFSAGAFANSGTFLNAGSLQSSDNITNSGTFTQSGPQTWSSTAGFTNTAGAASFQSNAKLAFLTITGGTFDTTSTKLIIEPTNKSLTLAALESDIANHSLLSSTLAPHLGLAIIDNATLATPFTTFGNLPADASSILIAPELLGDANLDGHVDLTDLNTILNNLGTNQSTWTHGNFDGAPTIDLTDLNAVLNNLGATSANNSMVIPTIPTPEPSSLFLLVIGGVPWSLARKTSDKLRCV